MMNSLRVKGKNDRVFIEENSLMAQTDEPPKMSSTDYLVAFSGLSKSYCIGLVDMVNSTKTSARMNEIDWGRYYEIFLNSMAKILPNYGGKVIKNQGDSLLYYFPDTDQSNKTAFANCIESSQIMIEEHDHICKELSGQNLPILDYRISLDYGKVVIMNTNNSFSVDLIGPPVNMCSKINHLASKNGVVIGGDLFENVRGIDKFRYKQTKGFSIGLRFSYPVYKVFRGS